MNALIPFARRQSLNNWVYDFDRLFEPVLQTEQLFRLQGDIHETDQHIMLSFDVPGIREEDFKLSVDGDTLAITGERKREESSDQDGVRYYGRQFGKFHRSFTLPESVDKTKIETDYRDGVLRVLLPKIEQKKPDVFDLKVKSKNSVFDKLLGTK